MLVDWSLMCEILENAFGFPSCSDASRMLIQSPAGGSPPAPRFAEHLGEINYSSLLVPERKNQQASLTELF